MYLEGRDMYLYSKGTCVCVCVFVHKCSENKDGGPEMLPLYVGRSSSKVS